MAAASFNVTGGASVALLGYSVVEVKGTFGTDSSATMLLPTGFTPMAVIGAACIVKTKSGSTYSVTEYTPTAAITCDSTTGRYKVTVTKAESTPATAVARAFIVGQN